MTAPIDNAGGAAINADKQSNLFTEVATLLTGRFTPSEQASEYDRKTRRATGESASATPRWTLQRGIREALGVPPDIGFIGYIEWRDIHDLSKAAWGTLDEIISEPEGRARSAAVWANDSSRTEADVLELVRTAAERNPNLGAPAAPWTPRPGCNLSKSATTKRRAVLVAALAAAATATNLTVGEVIERCAPNDLAAVDDWTLLTRLDELTASHKWPETIPDEPYTALKNLFDDTKNDAEENTAARPKWGDRRFGTLLAALLGAEPGHVTDTEFATHIAAKPVPDYVSVAAATHS